MTKFTFIDVESVWDEYLHEAYREIDPTGAGVMQRDGKHRHRLPCKRVIAAGAFDLECNSSGAISIEGLTSWTAHEHGSEREVVAELFDHLRMRPSTHVVTYSGLAAELPLLNLAALEHDLDLPRQLCTGNPEFPRTSSWRPHTDLALELKGKGRDWAHLSEIGLRLDLPGELFSGKAEISRPRSAEEWLTLRQRVSMDCVLTAMIGLAYWRANGRLCVDQTAMLHNIADWCLRALLIADTHVEPLIRLRAQMLERMQAEMDEAA